MIKNILAFFGLACAIGISAGIITVAWEAFKDFLREQKYKYRYKHRFDDPPLAKCFCRDCVHHCDDNDNCSKFKEWKTADNWFCWNAEPRKSSLEKREVP